MESTIILSPMSLQDAQRIAQWHYDAPYDIYNWPDWHTMLQQQMEFADEQIRNEQYLSLYQDSNLIGFAQLFPLQHTVRLALYLAPTYCNRGLGQIALILIVEEAKLRYPGYEIDLEVETWNERAITCYIRGGFMITDHYQYEQRGHLKDLYCMVYQSSVQ